LAASEREGVESRDVVLLEANPREPKLTTAVASLATALATAVVDGDHVSARDLAAQLLAALAAAA